ncbi:MAG TPA: enoyl-ACP reductase FabI [Solirubrobacterales bacterium]|nr:enoyl-ACP reductase FabI [Solirubrobacterales bacterium]
MLEGKRLLITGVATKHSIAHAIATEAQEAGAEVILTSFGRIRSITERAADSLPRPAPVLELDVGVPEDFDLLRERVLSEYGALDGAVHAIAWAAEDALSDNFLNASRESAIESIATSAVSFKELAEALVPTFEPNGGGSLVALDFDATRAWPSYDWMGVSKAALESISRYLARCLGERNVRVNLAAAGPIRTPTAGGIPGFAQLVEFWNYQAPLTWDMNDPRPVARAVCFLLSDWSEGITGEILHVDGGFHAMAAPFRQRLEEKEQRIRQEALTEIIA